MPVLLHDASRERLIQADRGTRWVDLPEWFTVQPRPRAPKKRILAELLSERRRRFSARCLDDHRGME